MIGLKHLQNEETKGNCYVLNVLKSTKNQIHFSLTVQSLDDFNWNSHQVVSCATLMSPTEVSRIVMKSF